MQPQRLLIGLALAAMVAFIVGALLLSAWHLGGTQTTANAGFCATAEAEIAPEGVPSSSAAPGQASFADQIPANCQQ